LVFGLHLDDCIDRVAVTKPLVTRGSASSWSTIATLLEGPGWALISPRRCSWCPEIDFGCSPSRKQRRTLSTSPRPGTTRIRIDAFFRLAPLRFGAGQGF